MMTQADASLSDTNKSSSWSPDSPVTDTDDLLMDLVDTKMLKPATYRGDLDQKVSDVKESGKVAAKCGVVGTQPQCPSIIKNSCITCLEGQSNGNSQDDFDSRVTLLENINYDGTMIWKIPQFSQRMEDARSGKYTSIFSLPFYSNRYGYKMCLRLYILGDGIGKNTHMSLFFVMMKGEFDAILQWPFTHKVSFRLINQHHGRDIVDVFQPDPLSSSFQRPKTDMNVASGCPRFISLAELNQGGFIDDNTIFIKVKVDISTNKPP